MSDAKWVIDTTKLDSIIQTSPGKLANVVGQTATRILTQAKMITPRDPARPPKDLSQPVSGALRANTDVTKEDVIGLTQHVNYYQVYALAQEYGYPANNLPARPYLTPTCENAFKQWQDDLIKVLNT